MNTLTRDQVQELVDQRENIAPLSADEIRLLDLDANSVRCANTIPSYLADCRDKLARMYQRVKPKAVSAPPVPAIPASPYCTLEEAHGAGKRWSMAALKSVIKKIGIPYDARLKTLEGRTASMADASKVAEFESRLAATNAKLEKAQQNISAMSKHIQSLEKKYGSIIHSNT